MVRDVAPGVCRVMLVSVAYFEACFPKYCAPKQNVLNPAMCSATFAAIAFNVNILVLPSTLITCYRTSKTNM